MHQNKNKDKEYARMLNDQAVETMLYSCNKDSLDKAKGLLKKAIKLDSLNIMYYSNLAQIECEMKNYSNAIQIINNYLAKDSSSASIDLILYKGLIFEEIGHQDSANSYYNHALRKYDSLLKLDNSNLKILLARASLLLFIDGKIRGILEFKEIEKKYPNSPEVKNMKEFFENFNREFYMRENFQKC